MQAIRPPAVAGMFYPANPEKLEDSINKLLRESKTEFAPQKIFALIVPHAGYMYSGKTAAYAYNLLAGKKFKTVIILSPSHREYFQGISIFNGDSYETPLGIIPLNKEVRDKIVSSSKIIFSGKEGHRLEHAVEVQLPFLQMLLKDFSIVPIVIGDQRRKNLLELAEQLSKVIDEDTLVVSSSDLSHFYTKVVADHLDSVVEMHIKNFDFESLENDLESSKCEACGGGTIVAALKTASLMKISKTKVLHRSDSGDTTGDESEVVGYLSAVIYK